MIENNILCFDEASHRYTFNEIELISVTTFLSKFFSKFDEEEVVNKIISSNNYKISTYQYYLKTKEEIIKEWRDCAKLGTELHKQIEDYLIDDTTIYPEDSILKKEFSFFLNFLNDHPNEEFVASELRVFDMEAKIAGTIDGLFKNKDGYIIYDWKRSKEIKFKNHFNKALKPINHLDDCNYNKYSLQLNTYKYILEKNYNIKVVDMYIVILYPTGDNYNKIQIHDMSDNINKIIKY